MFFVADNIFGTTGYATAVRELAFAMSQQMKVKCLNTFNKEYIPSKMKSLLADSKTTLTSEDFVFYRPYFSNVKVPDGPKLIANVVLESTKLPESLVMECNNDMVHQVWVPSTFCSDNYIRSGMIADKIRIIPHGYDPSVYKCEPSSEKRKTFVFGFVGGYTGKGDRKGADILVQAFKEEFKNDKDVMLSLKINTVYGDFPKEELEGDNIIIHTDFKSNEAMNRFYNTLDCFVCPTMGEGFGMTFLEALACGLPIISTSNGGQTDFLPFSEKVYIISKGERIPARFSPWDCGTWFKPDINDLKMYMRAAYEAKHKIEPYKGMENLTWEEAARKAVKVLGEGS